MTDIIARLRSNETLPVCPYDRRSPDYWTAPNDKPCVICGQENTSEGADKCRGADTRIMGEAANEIQRLRKSLAAIAFYPWIGEKDWVAVREIAKAALSPQERHQPPQNQT